MSLALDDLPLDHEWLLLQLRHMTEVVAAERSRSAALEIERDTVLAERDAACAERDAAQAEIAQEEVAARSGTPRTPRVRRRNLGSLPAHLPRVEVLVDVEDKSCPCCGGGRAGIGGKTNEKVHIIPAPPRGEGV